MGDSTKDVVRRLIRGMDTGDFDVFQDLAISWEPRAVHVSEGGDMAYMLERNVTTVHDSDGNPVTTHGKVVTVWRREADGSWKNVVDMWNEAPPRRRTGDRAVDGGRQTSTPGVTWRR